MRKSNACLTALGVAVLMMASPQAASAQALTPMVMDAPTPATTVTGIFPCTQAPQVFGVYGLKPDVSKLNGHCFGSGYMGDAGNVLVGYDFGEYLCAVLPLNGKSTQEALLQTLAVSWTHSKVVPDSLRVEGQMADGVVPISYQPSSQPRHVAYTKTLSGGEVVLCYRHSNTSRMEDPKVILGAMGAMGALQ
jgi:hypothetical protein